MCSGCFGKTRGLGGIRTRIREELLAVTTNEAKLPTKAPNSGAT